MTNETAQIAVFEMLADKYGWTPSQVMNERADFIEYFVTILNCKAKRQQRSNK